MNLKGTATKLMKAINHKYGSHVVLNNSSYFSEEHTMITMYVVKDNVFTVKSNHNRELFASASLVYIVFFLRDLWSFLETGEIPSDEGDPGWQRMKAKKRDKGKPVEESIQYIYDTYIGVENEQNDIGTSA